MRLIESDQLSAIRLSRQSISSRMFSQAAVKNAAGKSFCWNDDGRSATLNHKIASSDNDNRLRRDVCLSASV
jgi:hypothetical protein